MFTLRSCVAAEVTAVGKIAKFVWSAIKTSRNLQRWSNKRLAFVTSLKLGFGQTYQHISGAWCIKAGRSVDESVDLETSLTGLRTHDNNVSFVLLALLALGVKRRRRG